MAGLTDEGFEAKTYEAIVADIETRQRGAFGDDFAASAESVEGVCNGIVANAARELWEGLAALYAAMDPDGATGQSLTQLSALTGTERQGARKGRVPLVLTLAADATAPAGSAARVASQPTNRWVTLATATNPTASPLSVTVQAEQETAGTLPAAATTISQIATPVAGWTAVTNLQAASPGLPAEGDPVLRRRREGELQGGGTAAAEAIRAAISRVPLVSEVVVWENATDHVDADGRPPHSVEALVTGGDDAAVATALWRSKARGIQTFGTGSGLVTVVVADALGAPQTVRFSRPAAVNVYTRVDVTVDSRTNPGAAAIKAAVRAVYATLRGGELVRRAAIQDALYHLRGVTNVRGVYLGATSTATLNEDFAVGARQRGASPDDSYVAVTGA